jgi:hypothetical protein
MLNSPVLSKKENPRVQGTTKGEVMCDFISWVEKDKQPLFLTDELVFSARGREVFGDCRDNDLLGHGAIRRFYAPPNQEMLRDGTDHEVKNFWDVARLPPEIQALHPEDPESFLRHWGRMWHATPSIFQPDDFGYLLKHAPEAWNRVMRERAPKEIDCNADPRIPYSGWSIAEHRRTGTLIWNPEDVRLHLVDAQRNGRVIRGHNLRQELQDVPVLNACVLDHLFRYPHLIPEIWKVDERGNTQYIYFWGTEYRGSHGYPCIRYLCWREGRWYWDSYWLDRRWGAQDPAAVSAS